MTRKHTILIVDDARHNRTALREILNDNYIVLEAENGQNALAVLEEKYQAVTVIILDLIMPDMSGLELLEIFHKDVRYQNIPVIAMLRGINDEIECKCLEYGAWDFMRKPYDPMIVRFRVKNVIERSQMRMDGELKYRAEHDVLTGILNKSKFFYNTRNMLNIFGTEDFAFIRIDIEKFQLINSFFGMDEGDNLLKYMADYLQNVEKEYRYITYGRIEADIFAVCFSYKNEKEITDFVKKFTNQMEKYPLDFDITPFFGVYLVKNRDLSINEMYDKANLASKNCKGNYIQNYFFYTKEMSEEIIKEQHIINNMKNALKNEEFVLYLQPKYELQRNSIAGAEVLVRWITADGRMISPGEFIPVFERNGFILKLDQYVWEKTCQLLAGWTTEITDKFLNCLIKMYPSIKEAKQAHEIIACTGERCGKKDGMTILQNLRRELGIKKDGISSDGRFELRTRNCLKQCRTSPNMYIDRKLYSGEQLKDIKTLLNNICKER